MRVFRSIAAIAVIAFSSFAAAADGLVLVKSPYGAKETMDRLEKVVKERGLITLPAQARSESHFAPPRC